MSRPVSGSSRLFAVLQPAAHARALAEAVRLLVNQRAIILAMAKRDISTRYAGQLAGTAWAVGHPLFQMALLVFVFGFVFQQRIGGTHQLPRDYIVYILSGLAAWLSLAQVLPAAASSITGNAILIKQFTFDARVLPVKDIFVGIIIWLVSISVVVIYSFFIYSELPWTYVLLPILAIIHLMTALGIGWFLAALSVFFRDTKDLITLAISAMIYVLPVVYLPEWVPSLFQPIIYINPLSYLVWVYQDVLYFGRIEHPSAWLAAGAFAVLAFTCGYRFFRRLQPMFGSAL